MSHASNMQTIRKLLTETYERETTSKVPKRTDLTFGNKLTRMEFAVVLYVDMRSSRKILDEATSFISVKAHRGFLRSVVDCVEAQDGHFRSFNGDGALAFFRGTNASSRAVCAAMQLKAYVREINKTLQSKGVSIDFGVGIGQGEVDVAKSGKAGDDNTKQDLIWIGYPVYVAVELSDRAGGSYNLWISKSVRDAIIKQANRGVVYSDGTDMWTPSEVSLKTNGSQTVWKTGYYKVLFS